MLAAAIFGSESSRSHKRVPEALADTHRCALNIAKWLSGRKWQASEPASPPLAGLQAAGGGDGIEAASDASP